ncbi:MAG: hypothetical protein ACREUM_11970 [Nitrosospira sp.]
MRLTLLAAILAALTMTACGKPNQALPEQEKKNFEKITGKPAPADESAPASSSVDAAKGEIDATVDAAKDKIDATVDTAKEKIADTVDATKEEAGDAKNAVNDKAEAGVDTIKDTASDAKKGALDAIK